MPVLEFKGKQHIYAHHLSVPYRPLLPDPARSCHPAGADDNLIIHGDNLHALKALLPRSGPAAVEGSESVDCESPSRVDSRFGRCCCFHLDDDLYDERERPALA